MGAQSGEGARCLIRIDYGFLWDGGRRGLSATGDLSARLRCVLMAIPQCQMRSMAYMHIMFRLSGYVADDVHAHV